MMRLVNIETPGIITARPSLAKAQRAPRKAIHSFVLKPFFASLADLRDNEFISSTDYHSTLQT
jgi:hypothetical protein